MAYQITSNGQTAFCDAIETYSVINHILTPVELPNADGFKAFIIVEVSPYEEILIETLYAFPGHVLEGYNVEKATFEYIEEDEEELEEII